jgi:nucleoside phosphorylase
MLAEKRVARRVIRLALVVLLFAGGPITAARAAAKPAEGAPGCSSAPALMIVSAYPAEMGKIMRATKLDRIQPVRSAPPDSKEYWTGSLEGKRVIETLAGIGPVNATHTIEDAFAVFGGCISGVVFSGVAGAGSDHLGPNGTARSSRIGDVTVPDGWNSGRGPYDGVASTSMMAVAAAVAGQVKLGNTTPAGDRACMCIDPGTVPGLTFPYTPTVLLHGEGSTTDPFGGQAAPCLQHGGDLVGCEPCPVALGASPDPQRFVAGAANPALIPGLITGNSGAGGSTPGSFIESDEETGAVGAVANAHHVPFIGFRGISDGSPDPLMLPGFPSQFVVYDQLAADNSATMALAFIRAWNS